MCTLYKFGIGVRQNMLNQIYFDILSLVCEKCDMVHNVTSRGYKQKMIIFWGMEPWPTWQQVSSSPSPTMTHTTKPPRRCGISSQFSHVSDADGARWRWKSTHASRGEKHFTWLKDGLCTRPKRVCTPHPQPQEWPIQRQKDCQPYDC